MKKVLPFVLALTLAASAFTFSGCRNKNKESVNWEEKLDFVLEVPENGKDVVVLQLTDIQIIDSDQQRYEGRLHSWSIEPWKPEHMDELAFDINRQIVERVKPDLIVLSGDNVYGEFDDNGTSLARLIQTMESFNTPWTLTFGNHDNETRKGVAWTCEQYEKAEHCLFKRGDIENVDGNGNFNIGITRGGKLTEVVWLMDSNGHTDSDHDQNMYSTAGVRPNQIEWFTTNNELIKQANGGVSPKSIGFFHHGMRAYGDAVTKYGYMSTKHGFYTEDGDYGSFKPFKIPENSEGDCGAMAIDAGGYIDGGYEFHELLKKYNCEGWFFGHDHQINGSAKFEGVRYTYGLKASKYDSYTKGEVGGTQILLGDKGLRVSHVYYNEPSADK